MIPLKCIVGECIMNKNKGFTLIELLGTIVIIGILGTVAITSVVNIKKSSNNRFDNSQVELMKQAGQTYFTDNKRLLPIVEGQTNYVTLDKLIEKGYINKLYNSKKEEFDPTTSYAWVQKQNDGSYKYDCYCEIKGEKLAGTTAIPESKVNTSTITFKYNGNFYEKEDNNKKTHYTNGKGDAVVEVSLIRDEVSTYKYEIFKKNYTNDKNEYNQYKVSQRDKLTADTIDIKLKAAEYSEGEYYIRVTTYNESGNHNQSVYSDAIYVDKTPPTCNITTDYKIDESSKQSLWYNSKSKNSSNQALGIDQELPIVASGSDEGSGVNESTKHIFSDRSHFNKLDNDNGTYNAGNYSQCDTSEYWIDHNPPNCPESSSITESFVMPNGKTPETDVWTNLPIKVSIPALNLDSGKGSNVYWNWTVKDKDNKTLSDLSKSKQTSTNEMTKIIGDSPKEYEGKMTGIFEMKDEAGNVSKCYNKTFLIDRKKPNCETTGNSDNWVNTNVTLTGTCSDSGSECSDDTKTITKTIDNETNADYTPGSVSDKAGNSKTCNKVRVKIDKTAPTCNPGGYTENWYNGHLTLTGTCVDSTSGCNPLNSNVSFPITTEIQNSNFNFGQITDNAGNVGYCSAPVYTDYTAPTCSDKTLKRGNGTNISQKTWYSIKKAVYSAKCSDTGGSECVQSSYSTTSEGKSSLTLYISDNAGNAHTCETKTVWIDRTAPGLSGEALNKDNFFSDSGCGTGAGCQLYYGNVNGKYRGVNLTANNDTGASEHSPIADWGAQAKYETGGSGCAWGDGIDYKWSGAAVCDSAGSGRVKRCYKVKDKAGNQSDKVCTCQGPKGGISIKSPSDCF